MIPFNFSLEEFELKLASEKYSCFQKSSIDQIVVNARLYTCQLGHRVIQNYLLNLFINDAYLKQSQLIFSFVVKVVSLGVKVQTFDLFLYQVKATAFNQGRFSLLNFFSDLITLLHANPQEVYNLLP